MLDWNTVVTAVTTLAAAIFGGYMGARATKSATIRGAELAWENEHKRQAEAQRAVVRGFLLAIRGEVETIWQGYVHEVADRIESLQPGQPLRFVYRLRQQYFTVYESNCSLIVQVPDDELRRAIVETYVTAKGLIDTHLVNNDLNDKYDAFLETDQRTAALEQLRAFAPEMKTAYELTKASVARLMQLMNQSDLVAAPEQEQLPSAN